MPFCVNCGTRLGANDRFCGDCGSPVVAMGQKPSAGLDEEIVIELEDDEAKEGQGAWTCTGEPGGTAGPDAAANPGAASASSATGGASGYAAGMPGTAAAPNPASSSGQASGAQQQYRSANHIPTSEGLLGMAWHDVTGDGNWVGKTLLLSLIACVPILDFAVLGFETRWARKASFRQGDALPPIFSDRSFAIGFFQFVVMLIVGIVFGILNAIPVVGLVLTVLLVPFVNLMVMRVALYGRLGAAFNFSDIWTALKRNYGGLMFISWIPGLITVVVFAVVGAIGGFSGVLSVAALSYGYLPVASALSLFATFVCLYVCFVAAVVCALVMYRALGYWIARFMPEWTARAYAENVAPR